MIHIASITPELHQLRCESPIVASQGPPSLQFSPLTLTLTFLTIDQKDKETKTKTKRKTKRKTKERQKERRRRRHQERFSDLVTQLTCPYLSFNGLVQDSIYGLNFFKDCRFKTSSRNILSEILQGMKYYQRTRMILM